MRLFCGLLEHIVSDIVSRILQFSLSLIQLYLTVNSDLIFFALRWYSLLITGAPHFTALRYKH